MRTKAILMLSAAALGGSLLPSVTVAQTPASPQVAAPATAVETVTVIGSRRAVPRSSVDSPVPVDVVKAEELQRQGSTDIIDSLTAVIPSLSANREPISDAATLVRPVNLRALPSDHTLVLVNGKRRHRGAVVGEFVSGVNRGAQGVDINPLFGASLKQVDVLRDGAAAQYGSDAIAGVINYQLLDDADVRKIDLQFGQAYEGDGQTLEASGAFGLHIGDTGFLTIAAQIRTQDPTSRGVQDGQTLSGGLEGAAALGAAGFPVATPVVVWGQPEVKDDIKLAMNAAIAVTEKSKLYAFGTYATRAVDGSFFYRNPARRSGVFANGGNVLFANTTGSGTCPVGPLPTGSFAAANAFINAAPANCFAFFKRFPGGFTPRFGGKVVDTAFTTGLKGELSPGLNYDISVGYGQNDVQYKISNTVNASLGPNTPTSFDLGAQVQTEYVANADFSYGFNVGLATDLNVAWGAQYQDETFEIVRGEPDSFRAGPFASQGFSVGANGFQGFSDRVAGTFKRNSIGVYVDSEVDVTSAFTVSGALRYESFSDFGDTFNGKLSAIYRLTDEFAVRGSVSSGFRAPTLGQGNLQRASTGFSGGQLVEQLVIASTNPIAAFFGGRQLDAEKAQNYSIGATSKFGGLTLTADYFNIEVKDRVALTSFDVTAAQRMTLVSQGNPEASTINNVQFFINDFDSQTSGVDIVASLPLTTDFGRTNFTFAFNYNKTEVTNKGTTITAGRQREIEDALPETRFTFTTSHDVGPFSGLLRFNYFGESFENLFNDETLPVVTPSLVQVDAEVSMRFAEHYRVAIGAKNLLDKYPDQWKVGGDTGRNGGYLGAIYPLNHSGGFNGGSYYVRLSADF